MTRIATCLIVLALAAPAAAGVRVTRVAGSAPDGTIEVRGVAAGAFEPAMWEKGQLHLLPDARRPLLEPRPGKFRNIYAPSVVQTANGWDIYYGGWDGAATGNDRIYRTSTTDFIPFDSRETIIEHGQFQHVCNVSVTPTDKGSLAMMCTTYPDADGLNKPALFRSEDGHVWSGSPAPHTASRKDVISIGGYDLYEAADINGMNVLLHENGVDRLYFGNFRDFGQVFRASSVDGRTFQLDGVALKGSFAVNDVKKFHLGGGGSRYLMAMHMNTGQLWYALSTDGVAFEPAQLLCRNLDDADAFIVAVGWVTAGPQDEPGRRVLGFLYGAGAVGSLDANRIFARWLQKRVIVTGEQSLEPRSSHGPDAQRIEIGRQTLAGVTLDVFAEDGLTKLGTTTPIDLEPGGVYELALN